ncbi:hypothetical protein TrVFT333_006226 [Trichoderma virens FT-333]|nr:hypothetical protein TrVFT333_006226 [Trichoderma virens FT-333]
MPPFLRPRLPLPLLNLNLKLTNSRFSSTFSSRPSPQTPRRPTSRIRTPPARRCCLLRLPRTNPNPSIHRITAPHNNRLCLRFRLRSQDRRRYDPQPGPLSRRAPEFEGDTNPKTGEVGGPKNEPLRWGGNGDWSYNGRVTDF